MYKKISMWLFLAYTSFMFYRSPEFSDALIILGLASLYAFELFLERSREKDPKVDEEFEKFKRDAELENLKLTVEQLKEERIRRAELRSVKNEELKNGPKFVF